MGGCSKHLFDDWPPVEANSVFYLLKTHRCQLKNASVIFFPPFLFTVKQLIKHTLMYEIIYFLHCLIKQQYLFLQTGYKRWHAG